MENPGHDHLNTCLHMIRAALGQGLGLLVAVWVPVLVLLAIDPPSFISGWNEGRSGLLFASFFVAMEWYDTRKAIQARWNKRVVAAWFISALLLAFYYAGVFYLNLNGGIAQMGVQLGLPEMPKMFSWVAMWEHLIFLTYVLALFLSAYGLPSFLKMITPVVYLLGMTIIFFLDAAFPYGSLGPLQAIVLLIVPNVMFLLNFSQIKTIWQPEMSRLYIFTKVEGVEWFKGAVDFFWPCVGVHSMLIFFMIIAVLVAKVDASRARKIVYSVVGAIGTFFVNVLRIYLVCYYIATEGLSKAIAFHESAGEVIFMTWAVLYLLAVVKIEDLIYSRSIAKAFSAKEATIDETKSIPPKGGGQARVEK